MKEFLRVMKGLAEANRVRIVKMLQQKPMCVCELQAALGISQPSVSKHLKILQDAGLVESRKDGLWVNYFLSDGSTSPYVATLLGNLRHWMEEDATIRDLRRRLPAIRREEICRKESVPGDLPVLSGRSDKGRHSRAGGP